MNSFKMTGVGRVAKEQELKQVGDTSILRLTLIANDKFGEKETVTSVQFIAFNGTAQALAKNVRKGDQLIVEAYLKNNYWTDSKEQRHYDNDLVITGFRFGAPGQIKRAELESRNGRSEQPAPTKDEDAPRQAPKANGSSKPSSRRTRSNSSEGADAAA
jgi:single-strand DNA-binding protein